MDGIAGEGETDNHYMACGDIRDIIHLLDMIHAQEMAAYLEMYNTREEGLEEGDDGEAEDLHVPEPEDGTDSDREYTEE
jgi:hypothetical protein